MIGTSVMNINLGDMLTPNIHELDEVEALAGDLKLFQGPTKGKNNNCIE